MGSRRPDKRRGLFVGISTVDLAYVVEDIPGRNQKLSVPGQMVAAGGPATNAAITYAFLGGRCSLVTAVGEHPVGSVIRKDLKHFSIPIHDVARETDEVPPVSSILVVRATGERTVVSANAGAFGQLHLEMDPKWVDAACFVLVDGHYMPLCIDAAQKARERAIPAVLDGGSWKPDMDRLLRYVDVALCSDSFRPPGCNNNSDAFDFLESHGVVHAAITCGAAPVLYSYRGTRGEIEVEPIRASDTLGAGDIFHGAFCYWFYEAGLAFVEALALAARVSTFSCLHSGTRRWMQAFPGLEAFRR